MSFDDVDLLHSALEIWQAADLEAQERASRKAKR